MQLSFEELCRVLDPAGADPTVWHKIIDRHSRIAFFFQVDYRAKLPVLSRAVRVRPEKSYGYGETLKPTVYLNSNQVEAGFVSDILGQDYINDWDEVSRLLEGVASADLSGAEEGSDVSLEEDMREDPAIAKVHSFFGSSTVNQPSYTWTVPLSHSDASSVPMATGIPDQNGLFAHPSSHSDAGLPVLPSSVITDYTTEDVRHNYMNLSETNDHLSSTLRLLQHSIQPTAAETVQGPKPRPILPRPTGIPVVNNVPAKRRRANILADLKEPTVPVPKAYLAVNDATSPWPFQANLDGWTPLHTTFPNVTVEAAALGRLNIHAKRSSQFKWYIFCVMVGGKRGLARLVSLWQLNRANQYDAIFGSAFLDAFTAFAKELDVKVFLHETAKSRTSLPTLLSSYFCSWRHDNVAYLRDCSALSHGTSDPTDEC